MKTEEQRTRQARFDLQERREDKKRERRDIQASKAQAGHHEEHRTDESVQSPLPKWKSTSRARRVGGMRERTG